MSNKNNKGEKDPRTVLEEELAGSFKVNKARLKLIVLFIMALIQVCSVNLTKIAAAMFSLAETDSRYRRLQRFFQGFEFPPESLAQFVVNRLPMTKYILTLDRTNWKWGKKEYQYTGFRDSLSRRLFSGFMENVGQARKFRLNRKD